VIAKIGQFVPFICTVEFWMSNGWSGTFITCGKVIYNSPLGLTPEIKAVGHFSFFIAYFVSSGDEKLVELLKD
jgi:hypothetical protein